MTAARSVTEARIGAILDEAAAAIGDCTMAGPDPVIWSRGGTAFAVRSGARMEFRLDAAIGVAARRTPDTTASSRGADWVAFRPAELDQYAEDRVRAWFRAAARRAAG